MARNNQVGDKIKVLARTAGRLWPLDWRLHLARFGYIRILRGADLTSGIRIGRCIKAVSLLSGKNTGNFLVLSRPPEIATEFSARYWDVSRFFPKNPNRELCGANREFSGREQG